MSTLGGAIKEYPPENHALSHDSNPLAASVSSVRQKIKDAAVNSLNKPTKVTTQHYVAVLLFYVHADCQ